MWKLIIKDQKNRFNILKIENKQFILKSIMQNFNFFILVWLNAFLCLNNLKKKNFKISLINWCLCSINKKRFNWLTVLSRQIFLKKIWSGNVSGIKKAIW